MKQILIMIAMMLGLLVGMYILALQAKEESIPIQEKPIETYAEAEKPIEQRFVPVIETEQEQTIEDIVNEIAGMYNICPELILSVIEAESQFEPDIVSNCGAIGLMQIVPKWHEDRMNRLGVVDLFDPYSNILVGTDILAELFGKYGDDVYLVLMCYNEGQYGTAIQRAEAGEFSTYSKKIVERAEELERQHEKENK